MSSWSSIPHYTGPINMRPSTLAGAVESLADCPQGVCLHVGSDGNECLEVINCATVHEHFIAVHGIKNVSRNATIVCRWQGCGVALAQGNYLRHVRERHLGHRRRLGHANTYRVGEAERTREEPSDFPDVGRKAVDGTGGDSRNERENADPHSDAGHPERSETECLVLPSDEADKRKDGPSMERNILQLEKSSSGTHARTGVAGEELEGIDPQSGPAYTERSEQEPDTSSLQGPAEREGVKVQNDSPTGGDELELTVLPLAEAGAERGDSATESYSLKSERNVLESHVFGQGEVGEERDDADPLSSSLRGERNELELEVFQTGATVTEWEDTCPQSPPPESGPNICGIRGATEPPSVASQVSMSNHSTWTLGDNPSLVPPDTNLKPQSTSLISKLAKLFRRRKSPQGIQEKRRASPKIVHAGQFNEPVVVTPWNADRRAQRRGKANRHRPVMSMTDRSRLSSRHRDSQSSMDTSLHRFSTMTSTADTRARDIQTSDGEPDDEHGGCCFVCCFRPLRPRQLRWGDN